ncbi:hypothetical protein VH22019_00101 [Vibrio phage VH2_2019]|nr:hypothetical protein VH22019_00101 [Vibrio phage VH2_2019]
MIAEIGDFLGSAFTGGIAGLIGTVFTGIMSYREKEAVRTHEYSMRRLDIDERKAEADILLKQTEAEVNGQIALGELSAFTTSLTADEARYATGTRARNHWAYIFVDCVRGLMRPILTAMLTWAMCYLIYSMIQSLGGIDEVVKQQGMELVDQLVTALIFCTTTAITWWFGARALQKSGHKA